MKTIIIVLNILFLTYYIGARFVELQVTPERAGVMHFNKKYVDWMTFRVQRYSRRSPYYVHLQGYIKHTWGNNITVDILINEFLHNEYRRSFIEARRKLCDMMQPDNYIGGVFKDAGLVCPVAPGELRIMNMSVTSRGFPNVFPFEKGRVDAELTITATGESVAKIYLEASFVNKNKKNN